MRQVDLELVSAARNNDLSAVVKALSSGAYINIKGSQGWRPLHLAVDRGNVKMVSYLLDRRADVNLEGGPDGITPLQRAAGLVSSGPMVELLIKNEATVDFCDNNGRTVLHYVSESGNAETMRVLLRFGCSANLRTREVSGEGKTPMHLAGTSEMVELLVSKGGNIDEKDFDGFSPLHLAVKSENAVALCETLIRVGANISQLDRRGGTALCCTKDPELVKMFIMMGANPDILVSIRSEDIKAPLLSSMIANEYAEEVIEELIKSGADIDRLDEKGDSPLHYASRSGRLAVVEMLIKHGAKPSIENNKGFNARSLAVKDGYIAAASIIEAQELRCKLEIKGKSDEIGL